jgi:hypothetical protein
MVLPSESRKQRLERRHWLSVCTAIAQGLEEARKGFFKGCAGIVEKELARLQSQPQRPSRAAPRLVRTVLAGEADLAIKAFQLAVVSGVLGQFRYVPESQGADFADLLWAQSVRDRHR